MANVVLWSAPTAWADLFGASGASLNSLLNQSTILSSTIDNTANLYQYMDISFRLGSITPSGTPTLNIFLLELCDDGTTFNDGAATTTTNQQPTASDMVRRKIIRASIAGTVNSVIPRIWIPPNQFKICLQNNTGVTLTASGNNCKYRTYGINLNG